MIRWSKRPTVFYQNGQHETNMEYNGRISMRIFCHCHDPLAVIGPPYSIPLQELDWEIEVEQ
jgi:hypothetical protein